MPYTTLLAVYARSLWSRKICDNPYFPTEFSHTRPRWTPQLVVHVALPAAVVDSVDNGVRQLLTLQ